MYIFKLTCEAADSYDYYDSIVVCARDSESAKRIHPHSWGDKYYNLCWAETPDDVTAQLIGKADSTIEEGAIICASFNAG